MPVTTTTPAGRDVMRGNDPRIEENASAKLARKRVEAQRAADALNDRPDTTTPLETVGRAPLATKAEKAPHRITVQTTVEHRGRSFTIQADGITLDEFCDLLDKRGYAAVGQTREWQTLPDGTPICPKHHTPMRKRERQGDTWYSHSAGKGQDGKDIYCKGYHGKDSPGYEVD